MPIILLGLVAVLAIDGATTLRAQDETPPAVARLSLIDGEASLLRGDDASGWIGAAVNAPLVAGDSVFAGPDSRAEIQLDPNSILRLAEQTQVRVANLNEDQIQIEVSQGLMDFVVLQDAALGEGTSLEPNVEIDTPNVAVRPQVPGVYRIQVNSDSQVEITVRKGRVEVFTSEGSTTVERGKTISIQGTDSPEYQVAEAESPDDWDRWNKDRDRAILEAQSWQYANRNYTGANDLDAHGEWVEVPGYNWCWTPRVDAGWAPYVNGRWVWEPVWGWTWVSSEPWGWAPYHYGRWFWSANHWVWWPGPAEAGFRPPYAPAYVAFLGFGFGGHSFSFGQGYGFQQVGWVPLGPSDSCFPWWGRANTYRSMTITNATNITHVRRTYETSEASNLARLPPLASAQQPTRSNVQDMLNNPRVRESIVTVPADGFAQGQATRQRQPLNLTRLSEAQLVSGTLPVVPTPESLRPGDGAARRRAQPATPTNTRYLFARTPSPAGHRPFSQDAADIRQMMAQPYPPARNRASAPSTAGGSAAGRGWRVSGAAPQLPGDRRTTVRTSLPATSVAGKSAGEHGAYQKEAALEDSANLGNTPDNSVLGPREGGQESPTRVAARLEALCARTAGPERSSPAC